MQKPEALEAELAIRNCIARYGMAVDCGATDAALDCHSDTARYIVSAPGAGRSSGEAADVALANGDDLLLEGKAAIREMLESELHQSMLPNCAHTVGPLHVEVQGNIARVHGYSRIYLRETGEEVSFSLLRVAVNRWRMRCIDGRWLIDERESRLVGEQAAQRLLQILFKP